MRPGPSAATLAGGSKIDVADDDDLGCSGQSPKR
eukprot:CAMPEP_0179314298 /NCGR_PEP_ID=MMETSP0797-20121207/54353_1 /TAXON_ID=47934 /ORGANISM="Dinophysis acuminata, Strain DAEP01" /LENGTH=33 /DNA_ID= /DNA_START= /DNA_END= /DNA_ORIENTATION=